MFRILFLMVFLACINNASSQSILKEKVKYKVKRLESNLGYEAYVPLKCGDNQTIKNIRIIVAVDSLKTKTADSMYLISTIESLNILAKYHCKNSFSWQPIEISIMYSNGEISALAEGSAENSFGSRGNVNTVLKWKNGQFVAL